MTNTSILDPAFCGIRNEGSKRGGQGRGRRWGLGRPLPPVVSVALQAPLSMGFSRQEYWSGLLCPPPGDLPDPGIKPTSLPSPALTGGFFTTGTTWRPRLLKVPVLMPGRCFPAPVFSAVSSRLEIPFPCPYQVHSPVTHLSLPSVSCRNHD